MTVLGRRARRNLVAAVAATGAMALPAAPAHAIHLFPITPSFDPTGHDCAKALAAEPTGSDARVLVAGFNFLDQTSLDSLRPSTITTISAGETVTWEWLLDHCHSVTFSPPFGDPPQAGTFGAEGFQPPEQPELVRMNGEDDTFSVTFEEPGSFNYLCVHHASLGMAGTVVVTP